MAGVAIVTNGFEFRVRMICPDVRGLHPAVAVLAVADGEARKPLHKIHLSKTAARIFDKPVHGIQLANKLQCVKNQSV